MRGNLALWLLLAAGTALAVVAIFRPDLLSGGRGASLLYSVLLLAFVGSAVLVRARTDPGGALRNAAIWLAIFVALAGGYRLWEIWMLR